MAESNGGSGSPVLKTLTTIFGLFAGLASLVYIGGGLVMYLRLRYAYLPAPLDVTSRLAREVLISVGLAVILAPMLIFSTAYVAWRFIRGAAQPMLFPVLHADPQPPPGAPPGTPGPDRWGWGYRVALVTACVLVAGALTIPGVAVWVRRYPAKPPWTLLLVTFLTLVLLGLAIVHVRDVLVRRHNSRESFNRLNLVTVFAFMWSLVLVPACILFGAALRPEKVVVCRTSADIGGFFLGETDSTIYVGEAGSPPSRLVAIPWDGTEGLFIGSPNNSDLCDSVGPTPTSTGSDTPTTSATPSDAEP